MSEMSELKPREAIEILESIYPSQKQIVTGEYPDVAEALDLAIDALRRAQPDQLPDLTKLMPAITGETSDGYHTFNELYHHRAVLFGVICNTRPEIAWKSKQHHDGTMYDGMFIVGINTPDGQATYHYDVEPYWEMFCVKELPKAPEWDGHTPTQAIERIGKLSAQPDNTPLTLEELRGMNGEPVWVTHGDGSGGRWGIVNQYNLGMCADVDAYTAYWFDGFCGTIAYRRKKEDA